MEWINLRTEDQLDELITKSATRPQIIFKHSIRCSISALAKNRLDKEKSPDEMDFYYLDLINNRDLSDKVAEVFGVSHESPQVLVIKNGESVYDESHMGITMKAITAQASF